MYLEDPLKLLSDVYLEDPLKSFKKRRGLSPGFLFGVDMSIKVTKDVKLKQTNHDLCMYIVGGS